MKKLTIAIATALTLGTVQAEYVIKQPLEQAQGGSLPHGSIQFSTPNETIPDASGCVEFENSIGEWTTTSSSRFDDINGFYLGDYTMLDGVIEFKDSYSFTTSTGIQGTLIRGALVSSYHPNGAPEDHRISNYTIRMCSDNINELKNYCGEAGHYNGNYLCPRDYPNHPSLT